MISPLEPVFEEKVLIKKMGENMDPPQRDSERSRLNSYTIDNWT